MVTFFHMIKPLFSAMQLRLFMSLILCSCSLFTSSAANAQARLTVTPDRTTIAENETLSLTVRYENGSSDGAPDFTVLAQSFDILGNNKSSQYMNNNGRITRFNQWSLTLAPKAAGKALIPPLSLDGAQSSAITINVNKAQQLPKGAKAVFLETHVSKQEVYVQEEFIVTLKLFYKENIIDVDAQPFQIDKATIEELGQTQYQTTIGHNRYQVAQIRFAVTPEASGALEIPSFLWSLRTSSAPSNRFARGSGHSTLHRLRTDALSISVKTRPSNYPSHAAWLPAKSVTIKENWSQNPPSFIVGEPITRTIEVSARGISGEQLPPLAQNINSHDFKFYPDQPKIDSNTDNDGKLGKRTESVAIVPNQAGKLTLPAITITWWNTTKDQLETAELPAKTIMVAPSTKITSADTSGATAIIPELTQPTPVTNVAQTSSNIWPWFALVLVLLNMAQAVLLFGILRKKSNSSAPQKAQSTAELSLRNLVSTAKKAARNNDAYESKRAITVLLNTTQRKQLQLTPELASAIDELNRALYGQQKESWQGQQLLKALESPTLYSGTNAGSHNHSGLSSLYAS